MTSEAAPKRLFEYFTALFSFGLELDAQIAANEVTAEVGAATAKARSLLDQARSAALAAGHPQQRVESAAFAVVAWFDEIVARNPAWWGGAEPMQVALFNTNNAGNEFFEHLSNLKVDDNEVREVYYHAMLLGFVGQYYFETGNTGELGKLKELHGRQLPQAPAPLHTLPEERITPQPYKEKDPAGPRYPRRWDALLLKAGVVLAILIPLGYLGWFLLSPAHVAGPGVQQLVDGVLKNYVCSDLNAAVDPDNQVTVSGYVSKSVDLQRLHTEISAVPGVKKPSFNVDVRIWPHCAVIAALKPFRERNLDNHAGLEVTPTAGHTDRFIEGEKVVVKLTQARHAGYIYVDYYTVEGQVIHLYPNKREPDSVQPVPAGAPIDIGVSGLTMTVAAPFGQELVTVIASPKPLYDGFKPDVEQASDYLPQLHKMIEAHRADPDFVANFMVIQTEPKR